MIQRDISDEDLEGVLDRSDLIADGPEKAYGKDRSDLIPAGPEKAYGKPNFLATTLPLKGLGLEVVIPRASGGCSQGQQLNITKPALSYFAFFVSPCMGSGPLLEIFGLAAERVGPCRWCGPVGRLGYGIGVGPEEEESGGRDPIFGEEKRKGSFIGLGLIPYWFRLDTILIVNYDVP
ncbi:PGK [Artemisia annua]|uniref:PGK n=1 Tax=Artemisia annua TaxID=35608 RepID=A0A2U1N3I6_ARTAN|nr:PGK [Artemisia annua]